MTDATVADDLAGRFRFGRNWRNFLSVLDHGRIALAEESLREMLQVESLAGKRFLDAGSGSGLFSLAARRLGAEVHSFDFDPDSVACTSELRRRFFPDDDSWTVERGSVLEESYLESLGVFDIVYSWGVLHCTGDMWRALGLIMKCVADEGSLFIAIYNDDGFWSRYWLLVKKLYCSGFLGKSLVALVCAPYYFMGRVLKSILTGKNQFAEYKRKSRGMSHYYDWFDWFGGYPYEVAKVEDLLFFYLKADMTLTNLKTVNNLGCNELVLTKSSEHGGGAQQGR